MPTEPIRIESSRIERLSGELPFTVVRIPETKLGVEEEPEISYDYYYVRTGNSLKEIIIKAREEFLSYGYPEGRFDLEWISGIYRFEKDKILLDLNQNTVKGFNFWVPEGLLGEYIRHETNAEFPKIKTLREKTQKLYENMRRNSHELEESDKDLVSMLRDKNEPCSIMLAPEYLEKTKTREAASGKSPVDIKIMNYGSILGRHSTYFEDPIGGIWYQLMNKNIIPKSERVFYKRRYNKELPKLNTVSKIGGFHFIKQDKVPSGRNYLFFDGSLQDVFRLLQQKGVKFEEGILLPSYQE